MYKCIISFGSNYFCQEHFQKSWQELSPYLLDIHYSPKVYTNPINFPYSSENFLNQIIYAHTHLELEQLQQICKDIEIACGRTPELQKCAPYLVPMDIDIIVWGNLVVKHLDLERPYVIEGLQYLGFDVDKLYNHRLDSKTSE